MSWLSWSRQASSDEWFVYFDPAVCDLRQATAVVANVRVTGQTRQVTPELRNGAAYGTPYLYQVVPEQALPNGSEGELWFDVTMQDSSTVRLPASGVVTVRVYRA